MSASKVAYAASVFHVVSILVAIVFLALFLERCSHYPFTWDDCAAAFVASGTANVVVGGILMQICLALFAAFGGYVLRRKRVGTTIPLLVQGAAAVALSIFYFGGALGATGGALTLVAGIWAWPHDWRSMTGDGTS